MPQGYSMGGNIPASKVTNGLTAHIPDFAANDEHTLLCIVEIGVNYSKKPRGSEDLEPVLQIQYIEPITSKDGLSRLNELADAAFQFRTGETVRPKAGEEKKHDPSSVPLDLPPTLDGTPPTTDAKVTGIGTKKK